MPKDGPALPDASAQRRGKRSHARRLRAALWSAEVRRGTTKDACEPQTDTADTKQVDFHSLRRAFETALADAGQRADRDAPGWAPERIDAHALCAAGRAARTPEAALPKLRASSLPHDTLPALLSHENRLRPQRDLNPCYRRERPMS